MSCHRKIAIIGLGYVGLPLARAFGEKNTVIGFDIDSAHIRDLQSLKKESSIQWTDDESLLVNADFYIIAVPTPVDDMHQPDMHALFEASKIVGRYLKKGDIVVYESTVYPGATEEECVPLLEQYSSLMCGPDFSVGYSPERINAGDEAHQLCNIVKVVSGWDEKTTEIIARVYRCVVVAGIYVAPSIKVAEAAKVIENTQRDLNIALMNELAIIFAKMHIDMQQVLKTASTKWNFQLFQPGLVGGHCIGVDPYYLTYKAKKLGYTPEVILSGRRRNDTMGQYVAEQTIKHMIHSGVVIKKSKVLILGLTFKENCSDLRNSKVKDVISELETYGVEMSIHDPVALEKEIQAIYPYKSIAWDEIEDMDAIVLCVAHAYYCERSFLDYVQKLAPKGARVIFDVKSILNPSTSKEKLALETLNLHRL